jgi:hypothetical protein
MRKNAVICGIEHALRNEGCSEISIAELYRRVTTTRGNFDVSLQDFITILKELESDGLFEFFGASNDLPADLLIARTQLHPSVPYGDAISYDTA